MIAQREIKRNKEIIHSHKKNAGTFKSHLGVFNRGNDTESIVKELNVGRRCIGKDAGQFGRIWSCGTSTGKK